MDQQLTTVGASLARSDERMLTGRNAAGRVWKTGFGGLDQLIGGGLRAGSLILLAGPQGLGKSTFALQLARNTAASGRPVLYFSYEDESDQVRITAVRSVFDDLWVSSLEHRLESVPCGPQALTKVAHYSEMLFVHRSTGTRTDIEAIQNGIEMVRELSGSTPLVIIDYLQKVKSSHTTDDDAKSTEIVEGLKDLAIDFGAPILAIAAAEKSALRTGQRMRASHLRGSSALAYEPDVVMVLNNKFDVVARHHLTYDLGNAERFRDYAVLVPRPGATIGEATRVTGALLRDVMRLNVGTANFRIFGPDNSDQSGYSVSSAGDVNGDGFDDLLIGARDADASGNGKSDAGDSYVIFGGASLPATI